MRIGATAWGFPQVPHPVIPYLHMSDKAGGGSGEKMPVPEQLEGIRLEPFKPEEFFLHKRAIEGLEWDALDQGTGRVSKGVREPQLKKLFAQSLKDGEHLRLFLLKGDKGVDGFVAMKINSGKKLGTLTHVWLDERRHQAGQITEILDSSETYMRDHGCDFGIANAPRPIQAVNKVGAHSEVKNFWTFKTAAEIEAEAEGPKIVGERGGK